MHGTMNIKLMFVETNRMRGRVELYISPCKSEIQRDSCVQTHTYTHRTQSNNNYNLDEVFVEQSH